MLQDIARLWNHLPQNIVHSNTMQCNLRFNATQCNSQCKVNGISSGARRPSPLDQLRLPLRSTAASTLTLVCIVCIVFTSLCTGDTIVFCTKTNEVHSRCIICTVVDSLHGNYVAEAALEATCLQGVSERWQPM